MVLGLNKLKTLPNKLTAARLIAIPILLVVYPLAHHWFLPRIICGVLFALAAITDFFDGYLARKYHHESRVGALLDPIADKVLVASALILLTNAGYLPAFLAGLFICREIAISGIRMAATELNFSVPVSQWGKVKTAFQGISFSCLLGYYDVLIPIGNLTMWIALFLSYLSAYQYCRDFWRQGRSYFLESSSPLPNVEGE